MGEVLTAMVRLMAPVLSYTAEEVWQNLPEAYRTAESVHMANLPEAEEAYSDEALASGWDTLLRVRGEVTKNLEEARRIKAIGSSLEAKVVLAADGAVAKLLEAYLDGLAELFIVSVVELVSPENQPQKARKSEEVSGLAVAWERAPGEKCERCWTYKQDVGDSKEHSTLCGRCVGRVESLEG
jgi:isoleucyl-tRNA synthetase